MSRPSCLSSSFFPPLFFFFAILAQAKTPRRHNVPVLPQQHAMEGVQRVRGGERGARSDHIWEKLRMRGRCAVAELTTSRASFCLGHRWHSTCLFFSLCDGETRDERGSLLVPRSLLDSSSPSLWDSLSSPCPGRPLAVVSILLGLPLLSQVPFPVLLPSGGFSLAHRLLCFSHHPSSRYPSPLARILYASRHKTTLAQRDWGLGSPCLSLERVIRSWPLLSTLFFPCIFPISYCCSFGSSPPGPGPTPRSLGRGSSAARPAEPWLPTPDGDPTAGNSPPVHCVPVPSPSSEGEGGGRGVVLAPC